MAGFTLHSRLAADTYAIGDLALSRVLLAKDARFPWLILVPRRVGLGELTDLEAGDGCLLLDEIDAASKVLRKLFAPDRINVAAIGNIVDQLHVHVVARTRSDAAWPATVWGYGTALPYEQAALERRLGDLQTLLTPPVDHGDRA